MHAVILSGARHDDPATDTVHDVVRDELASIGYEVRSFVLREQTIGYCQGDFECWVKTPGICKADDDGRVIARAVINSDVTVLLTPITFGGYSSELKRALDKMICLVSPFFSSIGGETHHEKRYERYPRLLGFGTLPRHDDESARIFTTLVTRNAVNLHAPGSAAQAIVTSDGADAIRACVRTACAAAGLPS